MKKILFVLGILSIVIISKSYACFLPIDYGAIYNQDAKSVHFFMVFSEKPNFSTVDAYGRQANEFQFLIDSSNPSKEDFWWRNADTVIRGGEIYLNNTVRIRDIECWENPDQDYGQGSGGWGPLVGEVPYTSFMNYVSFDVPLQYLGDKNNGYFSYTLLTCEYGASQGPEHYGRSVGAVPEPATLLLLGFGLSGLGLLRKRKK